MKNPTLLGNLSVAILISLMSLGTLFVLQPIFYDLSSVKITLSLATLCYLAYLFYSSQAKLGKVTLALLSVFTITVMLMVNPDLGLLIAGLIGSIWFSRSLLFYRSILPSLLDLGLCLIGISAAIEAFILSSSAAAGVWCFLLIQALFVFIPQRKAARQKVDDNATTKPFNKAYQSAESAIRQLVNKSQT